MVSASGGLARIVIFDNNPFRDLSRSMLEGDIDVLPHRYRIGEFEENFKRAREGIAAS
jgi:hypothetical protein